MVAAQLWRHQLLLRPPPAGALPLYLHRRLASSPVHCCGREARGQSSSGALRARGTAGLLHRPAAMGCGTQAHRQPRLDAHAVPQRRPVAALVVPTRRPRLPADGPHAPRQLVPSHALRCAGAYVLAGSSPSWWCGAGAAMQADPAGRPAHTHAAQPRQHVRCPSFPSLDEDHSGRPVRLRASGHRQARPGTAVLEGPDPVPQWPRTCSSHRICIRAV